MDPYTVDFVDFLIARHNTLTRTQLSDCDVRLHCRASTIGIIVGGTVVDYANN